MQEIQQLLLYSLNEGEAFLHFFLRTLGTGILVLYYSGHYTSTEQRFSLSLQGLYDLSIILIWR